MGTERLNQILAVEQGMKSRIEDELTEGYKTLQKTSFFDGMARAYRPTREDGERLPSENKRVQQRAPEILRNTLNRLGDLFDITATKDFANCVAKANVVVDDEIILENAPATYLLFLEKYLIHVHTVITKLPTLDPAEAWTQDPNDGLYKTPTLEKARHLKMKKAIVRYDATDKHPAQTDLIDVDELVGYYAEVKHSAAFPPAEQKRLLLRVEKLQAAVKSAREGANMVEAPRKSVADKLFSWVFKKD